MSGCSQTERASLAADVLAVSDDAGTGQRRDVRPALRPLEKHTPVRDPFWLATHVMCLQGIPRTAPTNSMPNAHCISHVHQPFSRANDDGRIRMCCRGGPVHPSPFRARCYATCTACAHSALVIWPTLACWPPGLFSAGPSPRRAFFHRPTCVSRHKQMPSHRCIHCTRLKCPEPALQPTPSNRNVLLSKQNRSWKALWQIQSVRDAMLQGNATNSKPPRPHGKVEL